MYWTLSIQLAWLHTACGVKNEFILKKLLKEESDIRIRFLLSNTKMALTLYDDIFGDMNRLFNLPLQSLTRHPKTKWPQMDVDVINKGDHVEIVTSMPGVDAENVHVEYMDGYLTIRTEQATTSNDDKQDYIRRERYTSSSYRSVKLPRNVDDSQITAKLDKGILKVSVPYQTSTTPSSKRIQVTN